MTPEQEQAIRDLQDAGYAVIVWTPEELGEVSADWVEEMSISYGNEYLINQAKEPS